MNHSRDEKAVIEGEPINRLMEGLTPRGSRRRDGSQAVGHVTMTACSQNMRRVLLKDRGQPETEGDAEPGKSGSDTTQMAGCRTKLAREYGL